MEIFLSLAFFGNTSVNSYLPFLLVIITFPLFCCEINIWQKSASSKILWPRLYVSEMALMGHGAFNSKKIRFKYIINRIGKKVKKSQSSKTDISDFKIGYVKMFLNEVLLALFFRQKFQAALEYAFRKSDKNTPSLPSAP